MFGTKARAAVVATATLSVLGFATPAFAASNHGISGTPYSGCTNHTWYYSSNARHKSGTGPIKAEFSDIGKKGLNFKVVDAHNATLGHVGTWTSSETDEWQTLSSKVNSGTKFYNAFEEANTGCFSNDHDFTGTESY